MGIFVKAVAKCEGWYGSPKGKRFQQVQCVANKGQPASIDIELELSDNEIADVSGDPRPSTVMEVVDEKGYLFNSHASSKVQCPVCAKIVADADAAYKAAHPNEDNDTHDFW